MGKGSSRQAPADTTMRQTNLPEYADPYFRRMLQGAEEATMPFTEDLSQPIYDDAGNITGFGQKSTYQPYQGERIAPSEMYGDIQASRSMIRGIAQRGIPGMREAMAAQREGPRGYGKNNASWALRLEQCGSTFTQHCYWGGAGGSCADSIFLLGC